ncbi:MAG: YggS family pyridoxal phosphate-dependent enzyme [Candidatus Riflebacteria bacterium]|nr:YggS family pyridoxal phosphate-dependent enzyme [Candidatus Riflebacteria bacterium]
MSIIDNLNLIKKQLSAFSQDIKLIAVSKTASDEQVRELFSAGQKDFAENRPQTLRDRLVTLKDLDINWHFIGHLQRNKIKYVYPHAALVHSVADRKLIEEFRKWYEKTNRKCPFLLDVNISAEENKQGFSPEEVLDIIKEHRDSDFLDIRGLMGMAAFDVPEFKIEASFKILSEIFEKSKSFEGKAYKAQILSMGMSGDFEIAAKCGSNMVRIGSALFAS